MAIAVIVRLATSTLLTLVVVPVIFTDIDALLTDHRLVSCVKDFQIFYCYDDCSFIWFSTHTLTI
jgi:hypothetical protein